MTTTPPLIVTVANGHKVLSNLKCTDFKWTMQGEIYMAELSVIRLDGSSIILGIDWLRAYGKLTFDYSDNSVSFNKNDKPTTLKGIIEGSKLKTSTTGLKTLIATQWYKASIKGHCCAIGHYMSPEPRGKENLTPVVVQKVLGQYEDVFREPKGLPLG